MSCRPERSAALALQALKEKYFVSEEFAKGKAAYEARVAREAKAAKEYKERLAKENAAADGACFCRCER